MFIFTLLQIPQHGVTIKPSVKMASESVRVVVVCGLSIQPQEIILNTVCHYIPLQIYQLNAPVYQYDILLIYCYINTYANFLPWCNSQCGPGSHH